MVEVADRIWAVMMHFRGDIRACFISNSDYLIQTASLYLICMIDINPDHQFFYQLIAMIADHEDA